MKREVDDLAREVASELIKQDEVRELIKAYLSNLFLHGDLEPKPTCTESREKLSKDLAEFHREEDQRRSDYGYRIHHNVTQAQQENIDRVVYEITNDKIERHSL